MDQKIPFTSYDFWAYLSSGFLFLFAVDQAAGTQLLMRESWTVVQGVMAVACAYTAGQLVASASSWMLEKLFVGNLLGYPRDILFGRVKAWAWVRRLMPSYFEELPAATQRAVIENGKNAGLSSFDEGLFWVAYANARVSPVTMGRLDNFLNLYGFCRNIAMVALIDAVILYWSYLQFQGPHLHLLLARAALIVAICMVFRYLKFFRHYSVEIFTSFAYVK